ncbi:MAG: twin-arginine translocase TatA/TatE family subunit [Nitrospirae bacterium YQR-1]
MFDLGIQEMVVIFVVTLLVFGPKSMPEVAKNIGKFLGYFKKTYGVLREQIHDELKDETAPFKEEFDKINRDFLNSANAFEAEHKPFEHPSLDSGNRKPQDAGDTSQVDTANTESTEPADTASETLHEKKTHPEIKKNETTMSQV